MLPTRLHRAALVAAAATALCVAAAHPAHAQVRERLPLFVVDVQGTLPKFPTHGGFSGPRGLSEDQLPAWGPGVNVGGQVYLVRSTRVSFGVGATYVFSRDRNRPKPKRARAWAWAPWWSPSTAA